MDIMHQVMPNKFENLKEQAGMSLSICFCHLLHRHRRAFLREANRETKEQKLKRGWPCSNLSTKELLCILLGKSRRVD